MTTPKDNTARPHEKDYAVPLRKVPAIDVLKTLCDQGMSVSAIAEQLQIKVNTVRGALQRYGLHVPTRKTPSPCPRFDLSGQPFGRLVPQRYIAGSKWECLCECGNVTTVMTQNLTRGDTTSCGCFKREQFVACVVKRTHGLTEQSIYNRWCAMIRRCYNPKDTHFADYGGRGITVCERWRQSFVNFYADMGNPPPGMSLDRYPDNNGNYEPDNCRWATTHQQARNKRTAHLLTYNGETHGISTWAEKLEHILHLTQGGLEARLRNGWSIERAFTTPNLQRQRKEKGHYSARCNN